MPTTTTTTTTAAASPDNDDDDDEDDDMTSNTFKNKNKDLPRGATALHLLSNAAAAGSTRKDGGGLLTLGDAALDACVGGGLPRRGVVEFAGEAGVGKSQTLLSLLLNVQLPRGEGGWDAGALYVSTEGRAAVSRLQSMLAARDHSSSLNLARVVVMELAEPEDVWRAMHERIPLLLRRNEVKLVVIDSIAAPFRCVGADEAKDRSEWFFALAAQMLRLSDEHDALFVVANQVSFDPVSNASKPALGLSWSTCVTERFMLEYDADTTTPATATATATQTTAAERPNLRRISVVLSPRLPEGPAATWCISARGPTFVRSLRI